MKILIVTYGSQGDIRPLVALGAGLVRAGHRVVFPADPAFRGLIERHGLDFAPLSGDIRAAAAGAEGRAMYRRGANPVNLTRALMAMARAHALDWGREFRAAAEGADAVLAAGLGFYTGLGLAQAVGALPVGVALQPMGPTAEFPPPLMTPRRLPSWANKGLHLALLALMWLAFRGPVNRVRREVLGLPPLGLAALFAEWPRRGWPLLHGYSRHLVPPPADWPDFIDITGFWTLDEAAAYAPPPALENFLAAGEPPVYVGFGSMAGYDPGETTALVLRALGGRRAVLARGWGGLDAADLPPGVFGLDEAPHDWLFPRMAAIVHHGGA
ncbi:MAG TPA: glycosyltransferase, partial [Alphaproteobacteria bacterium]|nr:glycosyltransferase [Alphaproteobacteria bacterium]